MQGLNQKDYEAKKELVADIIIARLEKKLFPGLKNSIVFKEVSFFGGCNVLLNVFYHHLIFNALGRSCLDNKRLRIL